MLAADNGRAAFERTTTLIVRGDDHPHVFTPYPEGAPPELPRDHLHAPMWHDTDAGIEELARTLVDTLGGADSRRLALDDYTAPMWFGLPKLLAPLELANATPLLTACRLHKTADELECMRRSWQINEGGDVRSRAGAAAGDPPHRPHGRVLPPVLRAGRHLQLPGPGLADDARAHRRRAVEHQRRRAVRARHRRPPRHARRRRVDRHGVRLRGVRVRRGAHVGRRAAEPQTPRPVRALEGHHRTGHRRRSAPVSPAPSSRRSRSTPTAARSRGSTTTSSRTRSASRAASRSASAPMPGRSTTSSSCSSRA